MVPPVPRPQAAIETVFAERGMPYTRQRRGVWEFFSQSTRASTIAEATEALRPQGIGQATVYRTVTVLVDLGLLVRVQDRSGEVCFTATRIGHNHPLICGECRMVIDFDGEGDLAYLEKQLKKATGFTVYGHHLEVYGICAACRRRREASAGAGTAPDAAAAAPVYEGTGDSASGVS